MEAGEELKQTIREMPEEERPREKLLQQGPARLSNAELLALILSTGRKNETALALSQRLLGRLEGWRGLLEASLEEMMEIEGIGLAKAAQLKAVAEISQRLPQTGVAEEVLSSPASAAEVLMPRLRYLQQEKFCVVLLNTKNMVIAVEEVTIGGLNSSLVHPREVFKRAIRRSSAAIILAHNHPSGDPSPSREDIMVTRRLIEVGDLVGIQVLDHIIIGDGRFLSLKQEGAI